MRFLGLGIKDKVPDAKTIWLFKERLIEGKVSEKLFDKFGRELAKQNLIGKEGTIIDATIVEAPIQHNGKEENEQIKQIEKILKKKKIEGRICERGYRNKPLTQEQKERNRAKSKIRARIEHVSGFMTNTMKGIYVRTIGLVRVTLSIIMMNLTYNLCRYCVLKK